MPLKCCSDCKTEKPLGEFTQRKKPRTKSGKPEWYSVCKTCMRIRSHRWMHKNPKRYFEYEEIRATWHGRRTPQCAYCRKESTQLVETRVDNIKGLYHPECIERKYEALGLVSPKRKQELLDLINS